LGDAALEAASWLQALKVAKAIVNNKPTTGVDARRSMTWE
jgi:hypothetical protein